MRKRLVISLVMAGVWLMTNPPRPWPNVAKDARDRAAEAAQEGVRTLEPILDNGKMDEAEKMRRVGKALNLLQRIARLLEGVGAETRA